MRTKASNIDSHLTLYLVFMVVILAMLSATSWGAAFLVGCIALASFWHGYSYRHRIEKEKNHENV